ncbi:hypothetical protein ACQ4M4_08940 [Leptolyngbya sp. AN02str]|uniref:hypothetical protein n=1 Tax=Leptolyngbya sp. AN02str TaxID=3423363 RepID=UPI003D31D77E
MKPNHLSAATSPLSLQGAVWKGLLPIYLQHWHEGWGQFEPALDVLGEPTVGLVYVKRVPEQICYAWAIAHSLASRLHLAPTDIAMQLAQRLNQSITDSASATGPNWALPDWTSFEGSDRSFTLAQFVWASCRVRAHSSGIVQLGVGDYGVAVWLHGMSQRWLYPPPRLRESPVAVEILPQVTRVWLIQVAHGRCCSLLRLAADAGMIALQIAGSHEGGWRIPQPLPWLTDAGVLQCRDRIEYELVQRLVAVLDDAWAERITPKTALRHAEHVSDRLSQLDAAYPLFGATKGIGDARGNLVARVQVRMGLVCIAKEVLGWLLHTWLGAEAPTEL